MNEAYCHKCGAKILLEAGAPCPTCGCTARDLKLGIDDKVGVTDSTSAHTKTGNRDKRFVETPRDGISTRTESQEDGQLRTKVNGPSPQGEQDTLCVCALLIQKLNQDGAHWTDPRPGDGDVDCEATDQTLPSLTLPIQVVRAVVDEDLWHNLANQGKATLQVSASGAAAQLRKPIEKKAERPPKSRRAQLLLALDANRLPAHSFNTVIAEFRKANLQWAQQLGFRAIWIVGPVTDLVRRLDR